MHVLEKRKKKKFKKIIHKKKIFMKKKNNNKKINIKNNIFNLLKIKQNILLFKNKNRLKYLLSGISSFICNSNLYYSNKIYKKPISFINFCKRKYYIKKNKQKNNFFLYYKKSLLFFPKKQYKKNIYILKLHKRKRNKKYKYYIFPKFKFLSLINYKKNNKSNLLMSNDLNLLFFFKNLTIKNFFLISKDYIKYHKYINNNILLSHLQKLKNNNNIFFQFYKNFSFLKKKENTKISFSNLNKKINNILLTIKKNYRFYYNRYIKNKKKKFYIRHFNKNLLFLRNYKNNNLIIKNNIYFYNYLNTDLNKTNNNNNKHTIKYLNILNFILTKNNIMYLNKKYLLNNNYLINISKYLWSWYLIYFIFTLKKNTNINKNLYLHTLSKRIFNLNNIKIYNNNINTINNNNYLNNTKIYNNNLYLFNNKYKLLLKYIITKFVKYYKTKINNKIFKYPFIFYKYNKKYKYKISNIVKIFKKKNYFNTRKYNIKKFYKIWTKISKYINKNNKNIKKIKNINYFGIVTINICLNNTYITLTNLEGKVISVLCGGLLKIKGPKRSTNVASEAIAYKMINLIKNKNIQFIILKLNGILHTRKMKSALKAIRTGNYAIIKCVNITPKAHNGIRRKKRKRL